MAREARLDTPRGALDVGERGGRKKEREREVKIEKKDIWIKKRVRQKTEGVGGEGEE